MLQRFGFDDRWISWIKECLSSSSMSVLVNGSPTKEFQMQKGIRQGDPLAPLLFVLVAEGLTGLVREATKKNLFSGVVVGSHMVPVDVLQYADDTIFIGGVGVNTEVMISYAEQLHCKLSPIPFQYLGIPIGANPRRCTTWQPVIRKFSKKLSTWRASSLSIAGRVCLINSVLTSLPLYFMSFYRMPKLVIKQLTKLQRNFWWGAKREESKMAWV
uniref:Reverse transcriptase domain-containing protein n=1 Tax=Cajanus cajan TaxID=3821 RepID=A0A151RPV5_CAJCA|nr:hypothetical protein KK1_033912 [Cajanus cajan]